MFRLIIKFGYRNVSFVFEDWNLLQATLGTLVLTCEDKFDSEGEKEKVTFEIEIVEKGENEDGSND